MKLSLGRRLHTAKSCQHSGAAWQSNCHPRLDILTHRHVLFTMLSSLSHHLHLIKAEKHPDGDTLSVCATLKHVWLYNKCYCTICVTVQYVLLYNMCYCTICVTVQHVLLYNMRYCTLCITAQYVGTFEVVDVQHSVHPTSAGPCVGHCLQHLNQAGVGGAGGLYAHQQGPSAIGPCVMYLYGSQCSIKPRGLQPAG